MSDTTNTDVSKAAPAGGSDPAREHAQAAEAASKVAEGTETSTPAFEPQPGGGRDESTTLDTETGKPAAPAAPAPQAPQTPTPEEQAELDSMVDYTVKEGDNFPNLPDGTPVNVGDVVKLPKDHPLVTGQEGGTPQA